ncbi:tetratricopeptide repeat protein [Thermodesulfobacteriota bacterium]
MPKKIILSISLLYLGSLFVLSGCVGPSKAEIKFSMKEYNAAIPLYEEYLSENPGDSESRSKLGFSYFKTGKLDKAIEIFHSVLRDSPEEPYATLYLGLAYLNKKEFRKAIETWQGFKDEDNQLVEEEIKRQLTLLLMVESQNLAEKALSKEKSLKTIKADPNTVAVCYYQDLSTDKSLRAFQKALAAMVITDLSKIKSLKVIERVRLQALLEEMKLGQTGIVNAQTAPRVGRLLGAGNLIIGNLSKGSIKVTTSLTGTAAGTASATINEKNFYELPGVIIMDVAKILKLKLTTEEQKSITKPHTKVYEAFIHFGNGLDALDAGKWEEAKNYFLLALKADPEFEMAEEISDACPTPSSPNKNTLTQMALKELSTQFENSITTAQEAQEEAEKAAEEAEGGDSGGGGGGGGGGG